MNRATVIIPSWNGRHLLGPCLESLYRQEFRDFEVIVVDNGSMDGSIGFLERRFPQVRMIGFEKNMGFSAAVNAGIRSAETPYIALLNNDTEVHPLWLKELIGALEADPKAGSAASKVLFLSDPRTVNSAGDAFSFFGAAYQRRLMLDDSELFNEPEYVFSACGAAALFRSEMFARVGLFDEDFFAYQEDVDLGFRAQLLGHRCLFVPKAIVYHRSHMTLAKGSTLWFYLKERNRRLVLIKNMPTAIFLLCSPLIAMNELFYFAEALVRGQGLAYLKALKDVAIGFPRLLRERMRIQGGRIVSIGYLLRLMQFREPLRIFLFQLWFARGKELGTTKAEGHP